MPPPNKSVITKVEVTLKEIAALYDLRGRSRLIGTEDQPKVAFDCAGGAERDIFGRHGLRFCDEDGDVVSAADTTELPGVHQTVRVSGASPISRTFSRKNASPIDKKYVYVWRADTKGGDGMSLMHELYFEDGRFRFIDFSSPFNRGQDVRTPGSTTHRSLFLDVGSLSHFFYLAPYQIPWAAVDSLKGSVVSRGARLYDEFWTDWFLNGDPATAKTLNPPPGEGEKVGYQVYLLDPVEEAFRRHERYVDALDRYYERQQELSSDSKYVLAKRIDCFAHTSPELYELVSVKLRHYLIGKEKDCFRELYTAWNRAHDLVDWIGRKMKREPSGGGDTWHHDGEKSTASKEDKGADPWHSPFSQMVNEYRLHAPDDLWEQVGDVVAEVQSRLNESNPGKLWVEQTFKRGVEHNLPMEDGGAAFLFESGSTPENTRKVVTFGFGLLLRVYGPQWVKEHSQNATANLRNWIKATHGITIEGMAPLHVRRTTGWTERHALRQARGLGENLKLKPAKMQAVEASDMGMKQLALAVEVINLALAYDAATADGTVDGWETVHEFGEALDAYEAATKIWSKLPNAEISIGAHIKWARAVPMVGLVSGTLDVVLRVRDVSEATNIGQQLGHSLRTVGSVVTTLGAFTAEAGVGMFILGVGLVLQLAGKWMVANLSDAGHFLEFGTWGTPDFTSGVWSKLSDSNGFGYKGELSELHKDIPAQHKALDELIYNFKPKLSLEKKAGSVIVGAVLSIKIEIAQHLIGPQAKWDIHVMARDPHIDSIMPNVADYRFKPDDYVDHIDVSLNEKVSVKAFAPSEKPMIECWGAVKLDVLGDGTRVIVREFETYLEERDFSDLPPIGGM